MPRLVSVIPMRQLIYMSMPPEPAAAIIGQEKYTNAFLGYGPEGDRYFSLELTYNYGKESYDLGSGFGHFALGVPDVYKTVDSIKSAGS